ncbi:hypothetical protein [Treponema primitia]|uniref:hypothetical protein n=1 Tax=Treponema primitia TaxID=88058 RepID=UPI00047485FF|nr:hypothetical protein [Treponema primitia]
MHSRQEVVRGSYQEYQKASKKGKKELLDRLMAVTGLNRDYLAHALTGEAEGRRKEENAGSGEADRPSMARSPL